ncbi:MAG: zinc dependent phospholipase C family protein [Clostridiales bacterium]|nr:zinc dependent phospholipase C family protein [Clostridiales bacterium]
MKSTSHFAMGHLLYASLQARGVHLNRIAFVYGNIAPDYAPQLLFPTHFGKVCFRAVDGIAKELSQLPLDESGRVNAEYSKQLGIMCHFICDYFCFAHNKGFSGGLAQHVAYENRLDLYLRRCCAKLFDKETAPTVAFFDLDAKKDIALSYSTDILMDDIEEQKGEYLALCNSLRNDLRFSFDMCMQAILSLVSISKKVPSPHYDFWFDDLMLPLKGYATGNSMVFKMFFLRNRNNNIFFLPELMPPIAAF